MTTRASHSLSPAPWQGELELGLEEHRGSLLRAGGLSGEVPSMFTHCPQPDFLFAGSEPLPFVGSGFKLQLYHGLAVCFWENDLTSLSLTSLNSVTVESDSIVVRLKCSKT